MTTFTTQDRQDAQREPVAWIGLTAHKLNRVSIEKLSDDDTPLYAHPVKALTEEQIYDAFQEISVYQPTIIDIARAIERAHGIGE